MSIFQSLRENDQVIGVASIRTQGVFSNNTGSLIEFYTSSTALDSQKAYYYDVFQTQSSDPTAEPQFAVTYGHRLGSGSYGGAGQLNDSPTRAIYSQYKQLLMSPDDSIIKYGPDSQFSTDHIYAITFNRARFKQRLDPGNVEINIAELTGNNYANNVFTGSNVAVSSSNKIITLIDNSNDANETGNASRTYYELVSGSISKGVYNSTSPVYYGRLYPSLGVVMIDANMLNASASFNSMTSSVSSISEVLGGDNAFKLFTAISGAAVIDASKSLKARQSEAQTSTNYFIRAEHDKFNYSNNPTYVTGSDHKLRQPTFVGDPKTYITTVGLYDDDRTLLAVAKLSQPVLKSFNSEVLITVRLDY